VVTPTVQKRIQPVFDAQVGDKVTVKIDESSIYYEENKDNVDNVPIHIVNEKGETISYLNTGEYLRKELALTQALIKNLDTLLPYFTEVINSINNSKLDLKTKEEVFDFLKSLSSDETYSEAKFFKDLNHIANILNFAVPKGSAPEIGVVRASLKSWGFKIARDLINNTRIREKIGTDLTVSFETTISHKTSGNILFNKDKDGNPVYQPISKVFGIDSILLGYKDLSGAFVTIDNSEENYVLESDKVVKGFEYIGVPTARKENGVPVLIPIKLNRGKLGNRSTTIKLVLGILEKIRKLQVDGHDLSSPDIEVLRKHLSDFIIVNEFNDTNDNLTFKIHQDGVEFKSNNKVYYIRYNKTYTSLVLRDGSNKGAGKVLIDSKNESQKQLDARIKLVLGGVFRNVDLEKLASNEPYKSLADGKTYKNYKEFIFKTDALETDVSRLVNTSGQRISHIGGKITTNNGQHTGYPLMINIDTSSLMNTNEKETVEPIETNIETESSTSLGVTTFAELATKYELSNEFEAI